MSDEDAVQRAGDRFGKASESYSRAIDKLPNPQDRFDAYTIAGERAAEIQKRYARGRAGAAAAIRKDERLTLKELAERLDISLQRAWQLVKVAEQDSGDGDSSK